MDIRNGVSRLRSEEKPFVFGLFADVQYADTDDAKAWYDPNRTRSYRSSLNHIETAFNYWRSLKSRSKVEFALDLGDLIDGLCRNKSPSDALEKCLEIFNGYPDIPTYHTIGNHELYNFKRKDIQFMFKDSIENNDPLINLYYKINPRIGLKFISLDCFEIAAIGHSEDDPRLKEAEDLMFKYHGHHNFDLWDTNDQLIGMDLRFQAQNGSLSKNQLNWLDKELEDSDTNGDTVILFGHTAIHPSTCDYTCLLWNYEKIQDILKRHHCVVAYFNGHLHQSDYHQDSETGIHYVSLHGIIESDPNLLTYATVYLYEDHIKIEGNGNEKSRVLKIRNKHLMNNQCNGNSHS